MPRAHVSIVSTEGGSAALMTAERGPPGRRVQWISMMLRVVPTDGAKRVVITLAPSARAPMPTAEWPVVKVRPLLPIGHPDSRDTYRPEAAVWDAQTRRLTIDTARFTPGAPHSVEALVWGV